MNVSISARDPGSVSGSHRGLRVVVAAWAVVAVVLLLQGMVEQALDQGAITIEHLVRWRLYPVALWAAVTPAVMAASARWPATASRWPVHVAVHGALFSTWMLVSNALLRVPDAIAGDGAITVGREAVAAGVEYAPAGALLWIGLLVLGRRRAGRARAGAEPGEREPDRAGAAGDAGSGAAEKPLSLRVGYRTYLVRPAAIRWVEADGDYLRVHTEERTHRIRGPMKAFQRELGDERFLRIHRSTLVNVGFIREVQPYFHGDYVAILRDGTELRIPRSRRKVIRRLRGTGEEE